MSGAQFRLPKATSRPLDSSGVRVEQRSGVAAAASNGSHKAAPALRLLSETTLKRISYYPRVSAALLRAWNDLPAVARLDAVSSHVGMSPTAFSRYFTEKVGMTFSEVTKLLRIEAALDELERRDCSIEALARCSGYRSGCAFTRAFREVVGETPSDYRRRILSK